VATHGTLGLAFKKDFIESSGGARVWYLDDGSVPSRALFERIGQVMRAGAWDDELWKITPFIDRQCPVSTSGSRSGSASGVCQTVCGSVWATSLSP